MAQQQTQQKWQSHWRHKQDEGATFYLKRIWFLGIQNMGFAAYIYYLNNYRKDLPLFQKQTLIAAGAGYIVRELLSFIYISPDKRVKNEDLINVVIGNIVFFLPSYFAKSSQLFDDDKNKIINYTSLLLSISGHIFNSFAEMQRKWWMNKPENKGKVYTKGFFGITRHPNYFGDVLFFSGWALLSRDWKPMCLSILMIFTFYNEYIPEIEDFMEKKHGKEWTDYVKKVKSSLIPFVPF